MISLVYNFTYFLQRMLHISGRK